MKKFNIRQNKKLKYINWYGVEDHKKQIYQIKKIKK